MSLSLLCEACAGWTRLARASVASCGVRRAALGWESGMLRSQGGEAKTGFMSFASLLCAFKTFLDGGGGKDLGSRASWITV